ncbi:MAG: Ig-like domain-containing protein [Gemmatimonadales bacterium]
MRTAHPARALAAVAILLGAAACDYDSSLNPNRSVPELGAMTLVPRFATIQSGQVIQLTARLSDEFGDVIEGVTYTWTSSNESVAIVSAHGTVTGRGEGRAAITARAQGRLQSSAVQVLPRQPKPQPAL